MTKQLSQVMKKINDFNNNIADITIHQNKQPWRGKTISPMKQQHHVYTITCIPIVMIYVK